MAQLVVGDLVVLKPGSPLMVVVDADVRSTEKGKQVVAVAWIVNGQPQSAQYPADALIKIA